MGVLKLKPERLKPIFTLDFVLDGGLIFITRRHPLTKERNSFITYFTPTDMRIINTELSRDIEMAANIHNSTRDGYQRIAYIMQEEPNFAVFRRFDDINMLQLLSLQAEIMDVRKEYDIASEKDQNAGLEYSMSFRNLRLSQSKGELSREGESSGEIQVDSAPMPPFVHNANYCKTSRGLSMSTVCRCLFF